MTADSMSTGSPAGGTEAAVAALVDHIARTWPGNESEILAGLVIHSLAHFLGDDGVGADNLAAALNQRLAALPGDRVWQLGLIPRPALDDIQRAIAEGMREAGLAPRH